MAANNTQHGNQEVSERDPKYHKLPGEFWDSDNNTLWNIWTTPQILEECKTFPFRSSDVILATFPKSGTTLVQEALWLIFNEVDVLKAKETPVYVRVPFLELNVFEEDQHCNENHIEVLKRWPTDCPRLIKTHLPLRYIQTNLDSVRPKVIYVLRNPKDTLVSYYHFYKGVDDYGPWEGDFNEFFQMWLEGHMVSGEWLDVVSEWWTQQGQENYLFLFYEDILRQPKEEFQRIADFCGKDVSEEDMNVIVERTRFDTMRNNPATNYSTMPGINFQFMRKGQAGDWKNFFTVAQNELFNSMYEKHADKLPVFHNMQ